jgi:diguanylate cyclase (GGDEF)-like protein
VWLLNGVLALVAVLLWLHLEQLPHHESEIVLPWWLIAIGFAVTERCVVHIHFRRSAHSLTLGEIPLVLALLFGSPEAVVTGWVVGAGLVLGSQRNHPRIRLAFNLAQFGVTAGVAATLFNLMVPVARPDQPATWAAAAAAVLAASAVASLLVAVAMRLSGERMALAKLLGTMVGALCVAATNASMALAVGAVLVAEPWGAILLLGPTAAIFLAYRAYVTERQKHTSLEFLYDATRTLTGASEAESGLAGLLAMTLDSFRAEVAAVCVFPAGEEGNGTHVGVAPGGRVVIESTVTRELASGLESLLQRRARGRFIQVEDLTGPAAEFLDRLGIHDAMLVALPGDRSTIGVMVLGNRLGVGGAFTREDLRLFDTLAHHTGGSLAQDRLGRKVVDLNEIQRHLEHQAFHDPLTGLANRLLFMDRVGNAMQRRTGNAAVLYIDLDDFKAINDTLGHEAGDELLEEAGRRIRDSLRPADTPARLGGDEFAVLLIDIAQENAQIVAERILKALREPFVLAGRTLPVYASMGVALGDSGRLSAEGLIRNADVAMYVSKHGGKRGLSFHDNGADPVAGGVLPSAPAVAAARATSV